MKKVSIIIPVYNAETFLGKCIDSVIKQSYKNIEIILVNDGSTDNSLELCNNYKKQDKRIKVIDIYNGGASFARNKGIDICTGDYITFVDSDDYVTNDYVEVLVNTLESNDYDICCCCCFKKYPDGKIEKEKFVERDISQEDFIKGLFLQQGLGVCRNKLYKREIIGDTRFEEKLQVGEDSYFNLCLSKRVNKVKYIDTCLYYYCVNNQSLVRKYNENYYDNYYNASSITKQYVDNNLSEDVQKLCNNYVVFTLLLIIVNYSCNFKRTKNIFKMRKSIKNISKVELYKKAIKNCDLKKLDKKRKITVMLLKIHMYIFVALIGYLRQKQIKGV